MPRDAFAAQGLHFNACYVVPSLDLAVARTGNGPPLAHPGLIAGMSARSSTAAAARVRRA